MLIRKLCRLRTERAVRALDRLGGFKVSNKIFRITMSVFSLGYSFQAVACTFRWFPRVMMPSRRKFSGAVFPINIYLNSIPVISIDKK